MNAVYDYFCTSKTQQAHTISVVTRLPTESVGGASEKVSLAIPLLFIISSFNSCRNYFPGSKLRTPKHRAKIPIVNAVVTVDRRRQQA